MEVLMDYKRRGLKDAPKLAVGDGSSGFWAVLAKFWPEQIMFNPRQLRSVIHSSQFRKAGQYVQRVSGWSLLQHVMARGKMTCF